MRDRGPSLTALSAARHRAAHQVLDDASLFRDRLALPLLGLGPEDVPGADWADPQRWRMRLFIAARSRFAESRALARIGTGLAQLVILGAGLDTFAYRLPATGVRVFEVDHPSTQQWKREQLAAAAIAEPPNLVYVPADLEHAELDQVLLTHGFGPAAPSLWLWLGVFPYLTLPAIEDTLSRISGLGPAEVIFDCAEPDDPADPEIRLRRRAGAERVAALGEPWLTFLAPDELRTVLSRNGFQVVEDLDAAQFIRHELGLPGTAPRPGTAHLVHAASASG